MSTEVSILGAGLSGALMAIFLARGGRPVVVYERRPDPRKVDMDAGRSINLALADRGLEALRRAGVHDEVAGLLIPMRGRMLHDPAGQLSFVPYGQRPHEQIYSVSRPGLTAALLDHAERRHGVELRFLQAARALDFARDELLMLDEVSGSSYTRRLGPLIGADGAGSIVRRAMTGQLGAHYREEMLEHGYKELTLPAGPGGTHRFERHALHIWPRGGFMLIALPNLDGSFTMTLFLALKGEESFATLGDRGEIEAFFAKHFPDVLPLAPGLAREFLEHPVGRMGTVYCDRWADPGGKAVLLGDAAHAIVPFHGQGMNACFEDCAELDRLLAQHGEFAGAIREFERLRRPNTDAIAAMALENYVEMRDTVRDPGFLLRKDLAFELERRFPDRFIPRYSMVTFHHEIPYALAFERGRVQAEILERLSAGRRTLAEVDYELAATEIERRLPPLELAQRT